MKVGVVVPVLNSFKMAIECLQSLKSFDNELRIYIQPQWRVNLPLSQAWNNGFKQAVADGCDYVLITNDDILFSPYTVDHLAASFDKLPDNVIMVSANNLIGHLDSPYEILDLPAEAADDPFNASDHPNFSCFMVRDDFFDRHGRFDENYVPAWWEDNDSHYRATLLGLREVCTTYASCVHFGGVTTAAMPTKDSSVSQNYFRQKWGSTKRDLNELYKVPYNDHDLTPRDWIQQ